MSTPSSLLRPAGTIGDAIKTYVDGEGRHVQAVVIEPASPIRGVDAIGVAAAGTTPETVWGGAGAYVAPGAAIAMEVVSDDPADIGQTVVVSYLDAAGVEQAEIVTLTGIAPKVMIASPLAAVRILPGTGNVAGTIAVTSIGGGTVYAVAPPGGSFDGYAHVPADQSWRLRALRVQVSGSVGPVTVEVAVTTGGVYSSAGRWVVGEGSHVLVDAEPGAGRVVVAAGSLIEIRAAEAAGGAVVTAQADFEVS